MSEIRGEMRLPDALTPRFGDAGGLVAHTNGSPLRIHAGQWQRRPEVGDGENSPPSPVPLRTNFLAFSSPRVPHHGTQVRADRVDLSPASVLLDMFENVRVGLLLPRRQVVPVRHVGWLRIWEVLIYLPDPTESYEASLLCTGEFRGTAVGSFDECAHLIVDGSSTLPLPLGCFVPGCDVARFRLTWVVASDASNPCLPEDTSLSG